MGQDLQLPDWTNTPADPAFAPLKGQSLSEGIGTSYPVVFYRGKTWSFRFRGDRKDFVRPDDGTAAGYLDVIILGAAAHKSKSYYKKWDPAKSNEGERPICASIDGITPDLDVMQKQSDSCAICPRNVWKTNEEGRKTRECADFKRIAVLVLPSQTAPLNNGEPVLEPAFLRVPAASLQALAIMGDNMESRGHHFSTYVTRITFDPQEAHPRMIFKPQHKLTANEAPAILKMCADPQVERIVNGGFVERPTQQVPAGLAPPKEVLALNAPVQARTQQEAAPTLTLSTVDPPPQGPLSASPASPSTNLGSAPPATPAMNPPTSQPSPMAIKVPTQSAAPASILAGIGSGIAPPAQTQPASSQPVTQGVADAGEAEASDADLDEKILAHLGKKK